MKVQSKKRGVNKPFKCELCGGWYEREGHHKCKSGVKDIHEYYELAAIVDIVMKAEPLKYIYEPWKRDRDRALLALLACTGMRISEALSVTVEQFDCTNKEDVYINNVKILKRRKEPIFRDFPLPLVGPLEPLTNIIMCYFVTIKKGPLWDISRGRAWQIVVFMTGKWCHFFRCHRLSYLVNKFSGVRAAELQGVKAVSTISHYYKGGFRDKSVKKALHELKE